MASLPPRMLPRALPRLRPIAYICPSCRQSYATTPSSTELPAPPLLLRLRKDLKTAMREKDTARLNVLRSLLADVTSASKTNSPVKTDLHLLGILRKRAAMAKASSAEFKSAGREDLVEKEGEQAKIIEGYAGNVETVSADDVRAAVTKTVEEVRASVEGGAVQMGEVMKRVLGSGGGLEGKPVEKGEVARVVKDVLGVK